MNKRYKSLFKNIGIFTIGNFASKLLVFFLVPLYTSVLSTEEYGNYDIIASTAQLLLPIVTINIADAVMRFMMEKNVNQKAVVAIGFKYMGIATIIVALALFFIKYFELFHSYIGDYTFIIAVYFFFYMFQNFLPQVAKGIDRTIDIGIAGVLGTIVMLVTNIVFLLYLKWGLEGFFIANILGNAVQVFYYFFRLKIWELWSFADITKELEISMLRYSMPLILVGIGWSLNSSLDKYITTAICGLKDNGLLAIAYKIPNILSMFQLIFNQAWSISAIKEYDSSDRKKYYSTIINNVNMIITLSCSFLIILTRPLAGLLYSKDFYSAWAYVPFLLISATFNLIAGFIGPILAAEKNSKAMGVSALCGVIVNTILNIWLIISMGVLGATIATAMSSFSIYLVRKIAAKNMLYRDFNKNLYISWILMTSIACVEIWLKNYLIEGILFVAIIVVYRKHINILIKKIIRLLNTTVKGS